MPTDRKRDEPLKPKFGDIIINTCAGTRNPHRVGIYVETITRKGRMNPGTYLRCNSSDGRFWESESNSGWLMTPEEAHSRIAELEAELAEALGRLAKLERQLKSHRGLSLHQHPNRVEIDDADSGLIASGPTLAKAIDYIKEAPDARDARIERLDARIERLEEWRRVLETDLRAVGEEREVQSTRIAELEAELAATQRQIESDRTKVADISESIKRVIGERQWLRDGRGPYEWDDDRYRAEFSGAIEAILGALKPLEKLASDLSNSPRDGKEVVKARMNLEREVARLAKLERHLLNDANGAEFTHMLITGSGMVATVEEGYIPGAGEVVGPTLAAAIDAIEEAPDAI